MANQWTNFILPCWLVTGCLVPPEAGDSDGASETDESGSGGDTDESDESDEGGLLGIEDSLPGDLVITEVMYSGSPCEGSCQWIEIYNTRSSTIDLTGLIVQDEDLGSPDQGVLSTSIVIDPGAYVWLGRANEWWNFGDIWPDQFYGPEPWFDEDDSGDRVVIRSLSTVIDQTAVYSPFTEEGGGINVSWQLFGPPSALANDDPTNWCSSSAEFYGGLGTPGEANTGC